MGKTTLAQMVCDDPRVRARFGDRIFWVTMGRDSRSDTIITRIYETARDCGDIAAAPQLATIQDATSRLRDALTRLGPALLVVDDVWEDRQARPFTEAVADHTHTRVLVTTRLQHVAGGTAVDVDVVTPEQAKHLLTRGVDNMTTKEREGLLEAAGGWPLILASINALLRDGIPARELLRRYSHDGLTRTVDTLITGRWPDHRATRGSGTPDAAPVPYDAIQDRERRARLVGATIDAGRDRLAPDARARLAELGIFQEDERIPADLVADVWGVDTATAIATLGAAGDVGLIRVRRDDSTLTATVHDVYRDHFLGELQRRPEQVADKPSGAWLHQRLVLTAAKRLTLARPATSDLSATGPQGRPEAGGWEATRATDQAWAPTSEGRWWDLPSDQLYVRDNLAYHLRECGWPDHVGEDLLSRPGWLAQRISADGLSKASSDLQTFGTLHATTLRRRLHASSHLLAPTHPSTALAAIIHNRTLEIARPSTAGQTLSGLGITAPCLLAATVQPDTPHPLLEAVLSDGTGALRAMAVAPDGAWLATVGGDDNVRVWARSGDGTWATDPAAVLACSTRGVQALAVAPDGSWLAAAGADGDVRVWARSDDGTWATDPATVLAASSGGVQAMAAAPDGSWLATASNDGTLRIWARGYNGVWAIHPAAVRTSFPGLNAVAVAQDGSWLATASGDSTVRIWVRESDGTWASEPTAVLAGSTGGTQTLAVAPGGSWLATASNGGALRIWARSHNGTWGAHPAAVRTSFPGLTAVAVAQDGSWLATGSKDGTVRIWASGTDGTWTTNPAAMFFFDDIDDGGRVRAMVIAPDGSWLAAAGGDGDVRVWARNSDGIWASAPATVLTGHIGGAQAITVAPNGAWLATATNDGTLRIWARNRNATWTTDPTHEPTDHTGWQHQTGVRALAVAPDGSWLATADRDGMAQIWPRRNETWAADPDVVVSDFMSRESGLKALAVAPDGSWLATANDDGIVRIWDRSKRRNWNSGITESEALLDYPGHRGARALAAAPNGSWLTTASNDGTVLIWARRPNRSWPTAPDAVLFDHTGDGGEVRAIAVAPDGSWLATASHDGTVRVWARESDGKWASDPSTLLKGHTGGARALTIAPNGSWLTTVSNDGTVQIWARSRNRTWNTDPAAMLNCDNGGAQAMAMAITQDGSWLATASDDGKVQVWQVPSDGVWAREAAAQPATMARVDDSLLACAFDKHRLVLAGRRGLYDLRLITDQHALVP
ncbi:MAG: hypothetical protein HY828_22155 [Actinobacteria bacterium]|nr:hypothetical protein [Actinomycetota bacterium]